ncbi:MAG: hypothetical protein WC847_02645 [Candidatus Paceibacterota bacterium]|jgi:hypothetical protein
MESINPGNNTNEARGLKPEKREHIPTAEKLKIVMVRIASEVNKETEEKYGLKSLVDASLHINPTFFTKEKGGIYNSDEVFNDEGEVYALDRMNSGADSEGVQKHYKAEFGVEGQEGIIAKYRENKDISKSNQAEIVITALLHKVLKEKFLVVRSAVFDDYKHGIDNLILDKETGMVISAFDEVIENLGDKDKGPSKKIEKIKKIALKGGTEAKYGIALKDNQLTRAHTRNIPVFYLTLEGKNLTELADSLFKDSDNNADVEVKLFSHLVQSIREQKQMLEKLNLPPVVRKNLEGFERSLITMENFSVQTKI